MPYFDEFGMIHVCTRLLQIDTLALTLTLTLTVSEQTKWFLQTQRQPVLTGELKENWRGEERAKSSGLPPSEAYLPFTKVASLPFKIKVASVPESWHESGVSPWEESGPLSQTKGSEGEKERSWSYCWPPFWRYWEVKREETGEKGKGEWRKEQGSEGRRGAKTRREQREKREEREQRRKGSKGEKGSTGEKGGKEGGGGGGQRHRMLLTSILSSLLFYQAW